MHSQTSHVKQSYDKNHPFTASPPDDHTSRAPARETTMTPITATAVMVWRSIGAAMITLMAGAMENNVPTTRADVMRPDSTAYAPPTIMFSASA